MESPIYQQQNIFHLMSTPDFAKPWFIIPWRIHGAAIYGVPWIPSIYPSHVRIYTSTMDPSWDMERTSKEHDVSDV